MNPNGLDNALGDESSNATNEDLEMKTAILNFLRDERGLTTVEYAVAGGLITAGAITGFGLLGGEVSRVINALATALQAVVPG